MSTPYALAKETCAALGVDTEAALRTLAATPISLHCWQGDDITGFETSGGGAGDGTLVTGNYPGKARNMDELRADLDRAFSLVPGTHRLNLQAIYADFGGAKKPDRDALTTAHFQSWIDWCRERRLGFDLAGTFFAHPLAADGFTLSHADPGVRRFWIEHAAVCRRIAADAGRQLGTPAVTNLWIPDGYKDTPFDRKSPRLRLEAALDEAFAEKLDPAHQLDAVESKLFGIGLESYTVGSHEFYTGYAVKNQKLLCLDTGHFHPTETVADKISALLQFVPGVFLHVSRGVRWDSDHVTLNDDPTRALMEELVRGDFLSRTHIGLDFFDASINRVAAWVIGMRAAQKALLSALLEPAALLREAEESGDHTLRLALMEEARALPLGAVWNEHCMRHNVPVGAAWLEDIEQYERAVQSKR